MSLDVQVTRLQQGTRCLLADSHWQVGQGVIHTLMGPSGCGKSTLLAAISGTLDPAFQFDGAVTLNGQRIDGWPPDARRVGILFQDDLLFPHMTVRENLLFAVPPGPKAVREAKVAQALLDLELPGYAQADPATLSGGQRARVALMRALLAEPQALLLDEPFSRLDAALRQRLREWVFAAVRERGLPTLLVTHDPDDVADATQLTEWHV